MIGSMQRLASQVYIEWLVVSLRWMSLVGLGAWLVIQGSGSVEIGAILIAGAIWNLALTFFVLRATSIGGSTLPHRFIIIVVDIIFANLLFFFSIDQAQPLWWVGILPVITGALYFEARGFLIVIFTCLASLGAQAYLFIPGPVALVTIGLMVLLLCLIGLLLYLVRHRMQVGLLKTQRAQSKTDQELERIDMEKKRVLYNLIAALSSTLNYQRVLDTALDLSATAMTRSTPAAEPIVSAVLLFNQKEGKRTCLKVGSSRRFTPADQRIELDGNSGLLGRAIDSGEASLTRDLSADSELSRVIALRACHVAYCVPLRNGLDTYGVMLFAHPDQDYFTEERRDILDIVGHQAMIAIQNARLYRDLEQEKERITEIQEEARNKLARDLHDGPTQSVAALAMRVNFARRLMERDAKAAFDELIKVEDLARRTTQELRHMLFTLRPLVLESQGLAAALESMVEKMRETFNQKVLLSVDEHVVEQLEMNKQGVVFFIAEEAVNNARKHAKAENVWVRLKALESDLAMLEIQDDGMGFDPNSVDADYENRGSLGMVNMRERAELINGVLQLETSKDGGTRIQVLIPLSEAAVDRLHHRQ